MLFSERLKELRNKKNVTQLDLAKDLNLSRATIAGYENLGKQPNFDTLIQLARYFNVTTDYLIGLSEYTGNENRSISEVLGLTDNAIKAIRDLNNYPGNVSLINFFSDLISDREFTILLGHSIMYLQGEKPLSMLANYINSEADSGELFPTLKRSLNSDLLRRVFEEQAKDKFIDILNRLKNKEGATDGNSSKTR